MLIRIVATVVLFCSFTLCAAGLYAPMNELSGPISTDAFRHLLQFAGIASGAPALFLAIR